MSDFPNNIVLEHTTKIAKLETDVDNIKNRLDNISDIRDAVIKLTVLQEEQIKFSSEVSETLKVMNSEIKETKKEVKNTNDKVEDLEIKFEDKINEIDNKSKIDLLLLFKQYAIPVIMGGGIVYFILQVMQKI